MFKKLINDKILTFTLVVYIVLGVGLYNYIPSQMDKIAIEQATKKGEIILDTLAGAKEFYTDHIIKDVLEKSDMEFSYNHKNNDGLPYPAEILTSLNTFAPNSDLKIQLYSEFPFTPKINRKLDKFQVKSLRALINPDAFEKGPGTPTTKDVYSTVEKVDGRDLVKVYKVNYMSSQVCVDCHNTHEDRAWNFEWKLNDPRGVLQIDVPVSPMVSETIRDIKLTLIIIIISIMILTIIIFGWYLLKAEEAAEKRREELNQSFSTSFNELTMENQDLERDLDEMYSEFSKYIIYSKTDLFGVITEASVAFQEISGYTSEELIGKPHNIIRHPDMPSSSFKDMWAVLNLGKVWSGEVKNLKKDGGYYWVKAFVAPIFDKTGCRTGYIAIRHDITAIKDAEAKKELLSKKYGDRRREARD